MFLILFIVVGLVAWALHLMQEAIQSREFSLMLAGFLVSVAACGMMTVYFLMNNCVGYMAEMSRHVSPYQVSESVEWIAPDSLWGDTLTN
jgi:hypothetical protein